MQILVSGSDEAVEAEDFTVIAYAGPSALGGDAAVRFERQDDGSIMVTVQHKPAGPFATTRQMTQFRVRPWKD